MEAVLKGLHDALAERDVAGVERQTSLAAELLPAFKQELKKLPQLPRCEQVASLKRAICNASVMLQKSRQTVQALLAVYRSVPAPLPEGYQEHP
jgi:hypothetical protein